MNSFIQGYLVLTVNPKPEYEVQGENHGKLRKTLARPSESVRFVVQKKPRLPACSTVRIALSVEEHPLKTDIRS